MTALGTAVGSLSEALAAAETAARAGDVAAFEEAAVRCQDVCTRMHASGDVPPADELERLTRTHERVLEQALAIHGQLAQALRRAGRSRRAASAYSRR